MPNVIYMIADYFLIPEEAFLYLPEYNRIVEERNGVTHRIIFGGGVPFQKNQIRQIQQLRVHLKKQSKLSYLNGFPDDLLLRFLQATSFNNKDCIQALTHYFDWQKRMLPLQPSQPVIRYIKQGILYFCGRDYHFRPIVVVDIKRILDIEIKESELLKTLGFFFQYLIENCLIEGQVQTWNTIIDLGYCGVFSLGGTLIEIIKHLSSIFRARSNHSYLLKCPTSMKILWGMVKKALNQDQIRKISMSDKQRLRQEDFEKISKSQIEVKYGGYRPNISHYWPIQIDPYQFNPQKKIVNLITEDQYDKLYNEGKLKNRKIKKALVKKFNKPKNAEFDNQEDVMTQKSKEEEQKKSEDLMQQFMYPEQAKLITYEDPDPVFTFSQLFERN